MKLYMFDDNINKHDYLAHIVTRLNAISVDDALGVTFSRGFATPEMLPSSAKPVPGCLEPGNIVSALTTGDTDTIFLVDLQLIDVDGTNIPNELAAMFAGGNDLFKAAFGDFMSLSNDVTKPALTRTVQRHKVATLILCYCRRAGLRSLLVSTQAEASAQNEIHRAKLATLSLEITFPAANPAGDRDREIFVEEWARGILTLLDPWDRIRARTTEWFVSNEGAGWESFAKSGLPHNVPVTLSPSYIYDYKLCVQSIFPWFPDSWWKDEAALRAFHNCFKTTVGAAAQVTGNDAAHPLALGGAYCVFLVALHLRHPDLVPSCLVPDWMCFYPEEVLLPFLAPQPGSFARVTFRALHELFLAVLTMKGGTCGIRNSLIMPTPSDPYFAVELAWNGADVAKVSAKVRETVAAGIKDGSLSLLPGKTVGAFLRFVLASLARTAGFGSPGIVRLECRDFTGEPFLYVGQFPNMAARSA